MPWFKVDDHYSSHPAVLRAGDSAMGLWLRLGCWLARFPQQDDFIPTGTAKRSGTQRQLAALLDAGLLLEADGGYRLNKSLAISGSGLSGDSWDVEAGSNRSRRVIPASLRAQVYDRDGRACVECGATAALTLDHIYPWSLGGEDAVDNLQTLCRPCNSRKGARV